MRFKIQINSTSFLFMLRDEYIFYNVKIFYGKKNFIIYSSYFMQARYLL